MSSKCLISNILSFAASHLMICVKTCGDLHRIVASFASKHIIKSIILFNELTLNTLRVVSIEEQTHSCRGNVLTHYTLHVGF